MYADRRLPSDTWCSIGSFPFYHFTYRMMLSNNCYTSNYSRPANRRIKYQPHVDSPEWYKRTLHNKQANVGDKAHYTATDSECYPDGAISIWIGMETYPVGNNLISWSRFRFIAVWPIERVNNIDEDTTSMYMMRVFQSDASCLYPRRARDVRFHCRDIFLTNFTIQG